MYRIGRVSILHGENVFDELTNFRMYGSRRIVCRNAYHIKYMVSVVE